MTLFDTHAIVRPNETPDLPPRMPGIRLGCAHFLKTSLLVELTVLLHVPLRFVVGSVVLSSTAGVVLSGPAFGKTTTTTTATITGAETLNEPDPTSETIVVVGRRTSSEDRMLSTGFALESVGMEEIRTQTISLNDVLDRLPGIRVRRSGGAGSDLLFSVQGLSGRSIRFFLDGVPMEFFGNAFSINTLPTSLIQRVDVYKGSVPIELGGDALGGAVNLVTREGVGTQLEGSYSYGSFDTHEWTAHGIYTHPESGFTLRASVLGLASDNDYDVYGEGVTVADENFRPVEIRARRFNDEFESMTVKGEAGFVEVDWADRLLLGMVYSRLTRGIQTGQTMSQVFGDVSFDEEFLMPNISYKKDNFLVEGFSVTTLLAMARTVSVTDDTSFNRYDWSGRVIGTSEVGGELSGGARGRSLFTLEETAWVGQLGLRHRIDQSHALSLNLTGTIVDRRGQDEFAPDYTVPLRAPQGLRKGVAGASYELGLFQGDVVLTAFGKAFIYSATVNDAALTTTEDGVQVFVPRPIETDLVSPGGGLSARWRLTGGVALQGSIEHTYRLPDSDEALGDGVNILNAPGLEPEGSTNVNVGIRLGRTSLGPVGVSAAASGFYRATDNLILLTIIDGNGRAQYQNIFATEGIGTEGDLTLDWDRAIELSANVTYLDIRNDQELAAEGVPNLVFGDRLRNTPYLLANAAVRARSDDLFLAGSYAYAYWSWGYVHEFFLNWPSLGDARTKDVIPSQLVNDLGVGYTFPPTPAGTYSLAVDLRNALDEQLFDNFQLQRPGRALFVKLTAQVAP